MAAMDDIKGAAWRELKNATYSLGYKSDPSATRPILTVEGVPETNIEISVVSDLDNWTCIMVSVKKTVASSLKIVKRIDRPTASVRVPAAPRAVPVRAPPLQGHGRRSASDRPMWQGQSRAAAPAADEDTSQVPAVPAVEGQEPGPSDVMFLSALQDSADSQERPTSPISDDGDKHDDVIDDADFGDDDEGGKTDEEFTPSDEVKNAVERVLSQSDSMDNEQTDTQGDIDNSDIKQEQTTNNDDTRPDDDEASDTEKSAKASKKSTYDRPVTNYGADAKPASRSPRTRHHAPYGKLKIVSDRPMWDPKLAGIRQGRGVYGGVQTNGQTNYSCKLCAMKFGVYQHWRIHMIQCLQKRKRRHMLKSRGGDDFTEFIPFDTKAPSYNVDELVRMIIEDRVITFQEPVRCRQCCLTMTSKLSLNNHLVARHDYRPFRCKVCDVGFKKHGGLYNHMVSTHKDVRPSRCSQCERCFHTDQLLEKHMIVHSEVKPFTCDRCGQGFINEPSMRKHISKIHEPDNHPVYKCSVCDKTLATAASLRMHVMVHTGEKPHVCDTCGMRYRRRKGLRQHQRTVHDGPSGSIHELTHTGERPHTCTMCTDAFQTSRMLKQHFIKNHGGIPMDYRPLPIDQWTSRDAQPVPPHMSLVQQLAMGRADDKLEDPREQDTSVTALVPPPVPPPGATAGTVIDPYTGMLLTHYPPYGH